MISFFRVGVAALAALGVCLGATVPAPTKTTAPATKLKKKRYRSSVGKPAPKTVASTKKAPAKSAAKKVATTASSVRRRITAPRAPKVSAITRMEANQGVFQKVSSGATIPIENAGTLIPFFRTTL
jgi:hypothetical protein